MSVEGVVSGVVPLYYTSFLFGTVVVHCYYAQISWLHHMYQLLSMLSVLNHAKWFDAYPGKRAIQTIDKALAHVITGLVAMNMLINMHDNVQTYTKLIASTGFWAGFTTITAIFYNPYKNPNDPSSFTMHAILHVLSVFGTHCMIICNYS